MRLQSVIFSLDILILFSDSLLFRGGSIFLYGLCEQHLAQQSWEEVPYSVLYSSVENSCGV